MIRSFVAILVTDALREAVAGVVDGLRPLSRTVAWVPPQNLHVTLQFLGGQSEERLADAEAALAAAAAQSGPFDVSFRGIGAFPGLERPRILWIGLAEGALEACALQARLAASLETHGFPKEDRPWHPHLTIGRVFEGRRWQHETSPPLRRALAQAASTTFGTLRVAEVALMRSDLSPEGARHTLRRRAALSGGAHSGRVGGRP